MAFGLRKGCGIAKETPVMTKNGNVFVEKLKPGDLVLTHKLRWQKVVAVREHKTNDYYYVNINGWPSILVEEGCLFYTLERVQGNQHVGPCWTDMSMLHEAHLCAFPFQAVNGKNCMGWYRFEGCSPSMAVAETSFYEVTVEGDDSLTVNGIVVRCG